MDPSPCAIGGQSWTGTEELAQSNRTGRAQILSNPVCETPSCARKYLGVVVRGMMTWDEWKSS